MSRGMRRARELYLLRNTIAGALLFGFIVSVYGYSMGAVKQESFDDVDELALVQSMNQNTSTKPAPITAPARDTDTPRLAAAAEPAPAHGGKLVPAPLGASTPARTRGILPQLLSSRYPWLLDPVSKTFVWGAPPIDRIGSWSDARKR